MDLMSIVNEDHQQNGLCFQNRYLETGEFRGTGAQGRAFSVRDTILGENGLIMKMSSLSESYQRELLVLKAMTAHRGFPYLYDFFTIPEELGGEHCFVTNYEGECIGTIAARSERRFSYSNLMRIAFKLFWTLETLHMKGFCHRDIHWENVLLRRERDGILHLKIIDFGLSLPLEPSPSPEQNLTSWHASLQVCRNQSYTRFDDLTSAIFLVMRFVPLNPFGAERREYQTLKAEFDQDPFEIFNDELEWIAGLYSEVSLQRTTGYSHTDLFDIFYKFNPGFDPTSPITYRIVRNQLIID
ncbi:Protein CBG02188 [Caenorhabditis briggsae]|uniref:Protein CBG02188 n=2 Tax=Caenorhabditis briggsae TaxID=6238 RepID=A8WS50_CAEBR|nr:Protein CBG02188 [Caenorhabditis briggsae]CAP23308.1 Protein CBG02188 [Caenorhabditis briggsae]